MSNLYERIISLCNDKGITPYRMCKDIKMQPSVITDLKMGRRKTVKIETAGSIAEYFGVSTDYLLGKEKEPTTVSGSELNEKIIQISERIAALPPDKQKAVFDLLDILDQYEKADQ